MEEIEITYKPQLLKLQEGIKNLTEDKEAKERSLQNVIAEIQQVQKTCEQQRVSQKEVKDQIVQKNVSVLETQEMFELQKQKDQLNEYGIMKGSYISVEVEEGNNLKAYDNADSYLILEFEGQKLKTEIAKERVQAEIQQNLKFDVVQGKDNIIVKSYDRSQSSSDGLNGIGNIDLAQLRDQMSHSIVVKLSDPEGTEKDCGTIRIKLAWKWSQSAELDRNIQDIKTEIDQLQEINFLNLSLVEDNTNQLDILIDQQSMLENEILQIKKRIQKDENQLSKLLVEKEQKLESFKKEQEVLRRASIRQQQEEDQRIRNENKNKIKQAQTEEYKNTQQETLNDSQKLNQQPSLEPKQNEIFSSVPSLVRDTFSVVTHDLKIKLDMARKQLENEKKLKKEKQQVETSANSSILQEQEKNKYEERKAKKSFEYNEQRKCICLLF